MTDKINLSGLMHRNYVVIKTSGTVFPNTDRPRPAINMFIFFSVGNSLKEIFVLIFY